MDPDIRRELDEIHSLAKDNHKMLRKIRRSQWTSTISTIIIWVAVLALPLYLYQAYFAPVISKISTLSGMSTTTTSTLLGIPSEASGELQNLVHFFTGNK